MRPGFTIPRSVPKVGSSRLDSCVRHSLGVRSLCERVLNMRTLLVLACACAVVQFTNSQEVSDDQEESAVEQLTDEFENAGYNGPTTVSYYEDVTRISDYSGRSAGFGQRGKYQAIDQYEQSSAPRGTNSKVCIEKNERYPVPGSCDRYIECLNGTAEEKQCPDGLRYNPNVKFNVYPCQYPTDVECLARSSLQPAQPTDQCPHQFGYFKTGDAKNCSGFRNCVNGIGYDFVCPDGLAFSADTYRCEWPDQVADCDAEAFLGFKCPVIPVSKELGPPAGYRYYRSSTDCQTYFICIEGKPRRLGCGGYSAFDETTESCVSAEEVAACPNELKTAATRSKKEEQERSTAEQAYQKQKSQKPYGKIGRVRAYEEYTTTNIPDLFDEIEEGAEI
ncbi:protein obstructor-E-like [Epargyreus clarus]|uniref:protein obstructor-E-like n=1 Tax=Epargyreus clarus TaxID=520877 RepID=UPI003C2FF211